MRHRRIGPASCSTRYRNGTEESIILMICFTDPLKSWPFLTASAANARRRFTSSRRAAAGKRDDRSP